MPTILMITDKANDSNITRTIFLVPLYLFRTLRTHRYPWSARLNPLFSSMSTVLNFPRGDVVNLLAGVDLLSSSRRFPRQWFLCSCPPSRTVRLSNGNYECILFILREWFVTSPLISDSFISMMRLQGLQHTTLGYDLPLTRLPEPRPLNPELTLSVISYTPPANPLLHSQQAHREVAKFTASPLCRRYQPSGLEEFGLTLLADKKAARSSSTEWRWSTL